MENSALYGMLMWRALWEAWSHLLELSGRSYETLQSKEMHSNRKSTWKINEQDRTLIYFVVVYL